MDASDIFFCFTKTHDSIMGMLVLLQKLSVNNLGVYQALSCETLCVFYNQRSFYTISRNSVVECPCYLSQTLRYNIDFIYVL
jgi:hypothetical protein